MMNKSCAVIAGAMVSAVGSLLTLASPAMGDSAGSPSMPGPFTDQVLQKAVDAVNAAESSAGIKAPMTFSPISGHVTNVSNYENWFVCGQSPTAGDPLSADTSHITLIVRRPDAKCPEA
jgi:hypothetical protein